MQLFFWLQETHFINVDRTQLHSNGHRNNWVGGKRQKGVMLL